MTLREKLVSGCMIYTCYSHINHESLLGIVCTRTITNIEIMWADIGIKMSYNINAIVEIIGFGNWEVIP